MPGEHGPCVKPGAVPAQDLVTYGRGKAPPNVEQHVNACPVCREKGEAYARIERVLLGELFRRTCPPSIAIGEYAMGLLPSAEARLVEDHLAECPRCRAERHEFDAFLAE